MANHRISLILTSQQTGMVWLRHSLLGVVLLVGLAGLGFSIAALMPPNVYHKDFMQEYLMARAVLDGVDPYLPLPELAATYLGDLPRITLLHPNPHPPPVLLLSLPFGLISYELASVLWFLCELGWIFLSVYLLLGLWGRPRTIRLALLGSLLMLSWRPMVANLGYGQLMTLLLALLIGAWIALRSGREILGGGLVGLVMAVKLMAWPVVIFLLLQRRWKAVGAAGGIWLTLNLVAGWMMGFERVIYYYFSVSREVFPIYRSHEGNFSLWTIGWRFFEGTGTSGQSGVVAPPLAAWPAGAILLSIGLPLICLIWGLVIARRCRSFDAAFAVLVCVSLLVNPISWVVYHLILCLIPLSFLVIRLTQFDFPKVETSLAAFSILFLFLPREILVAALRLIANISSAASFAELSFGAALVTLLPVVVLLLLIWLIQRLDAQPGMPTAAPVVEPLRAME